MIEQNYCSKIIQKKEEMNQNQIRSYNSPRKSYQIKKDEEMKLEKRFLGLSLTKTVPINQNSKPSSFKTKRLAGHLSSN